MTNEQIENPLDYVLQFKWAHRYNWRDKSDAYWFDRLIKEITELQAALFSYHRDSAEHELAQVASICLNWLDYRLDIPPLSIFTDDFDLFVARDMGQVMDLFAHTYGEIYRGELNDWRRVDADEKIGAFFEDPAYEIYMRLVRFGFELTENGDNGSVLATGPAWKWTLFNGPGFLFSTEG